MFWVNFFFFLWIRVKHFLALNTRLLRLAFCYFFHVIAFSLFSYFSFAWLAGLHCVLAQFIG